MPPPSIAERNRMKAFVEHAGKRLPPSPQKSRRGDRSPETVFTDNLESLNIIQADSPYAKADDDVFNENTRPPSVQSVDARRSARLDHLFNGSELSEGFMRSGRSTPTAEYDEKVPVKYTSNPPPRQLPPRKPFRPVHEPSNSLPALTVGSDFRMAVVPAQRQSNVADMKDGFSAAAVKQIQSRHPSSPVRREHYRHHNSVPARAVTQEPPQGDEQRRGRAQSRTHSRPRYGAFSPAFNDSDDGLNSTQGEEDLLATPRSKQIPLRTRVHYAASPVKPSVENKKRQRSVDYDDRALNGMEYRELQQQPFDFDPATATSVNSLAGQGGDGEQRLAQMRLMGTAEQQRFFGNMSVDEWESAGDWFAEQFTGIMRRLTEARKAKRQIVESFEQEAAAREAEVRLRSDKIDEKLHRMREDGLKVVGGRS